MKSPNDRNDLIEAFEKVRDIPYRCPESVDEDDYRCWGKNRMLADDLRKLGYDVRFRVCRFSWEKQKLPIKLTSQAPSDIDYHPFLEIMLGDKWVVVDATLDTDFSGHNVWDGISDCKISIKYNEILSVEESDANEKKEDFRKRDKSWLEFHKKVNEFFDKMKKKQ